MGKARAGKAWLIGLTVGQVVLACSGSSRDCVRSRDCPVDIGGVADLLDGGSGGEEEGAVTETEALAGAAGSCAGQSAGEPARAASGEEAGAGGSRDAPHDEPYVLRVSPADGELGVRQDAEFEVDFSRTMDPVATAAAFESPDFARAELAFSWNADYTRLRLEPLIPLEYAEGQLLDATFPARRYQFGFGAAARDAAGRRLAPVHFSFSTLRQGHATLSAEATRTGNWTVSQGEGIHNCVRLPQAPYQPTVCIGDDLNNVRYGGFVSFDLSPIGSQVVAFSNARIAAQGSINGLPSALGADRIEHVWFGELGPQALSDLAGQSLGPFLMPAVGSREGSVALLVDVTTSVSEDYSARTRLASRSQYRLTFASVLANGRWDDVELPTSTIRLLVSCLLP